MIEPLNTLKFIINHMRIYESFILGFRKEGSYEKFELLEPGVGISAQHTPYLVDVAWYTLI